MDVDKLYKLELLTQNSFIADLRKTMDKYNLSLDDDCFSLGQLRSKGWAANVACAVNVDEPRRIFLEAGWYGILAAMIFENSISSNIEWIRSFDIDPSCAAIAESFNKTYVKNDWQFKATTCDIHDITYPFTYETLKANGDTVELTEDPNIIINTSCEHIENFDVWYDKLPTDVFLILQSTDMPHDDHINTVRTIDEFKKQCPMKRYDIASQMHLELGTRFMLVGKKYDKGKGIK